MRGALLSAVLLSTIPTAAVYASSDSGISYRCQKSGGRYVMINGSNCFPHESVDSQVRRRPGVVVKH